MGENFEMNHMFTNVEMFVQEMPTMPMILHPNIYKRIEHIQPTSINELYNIPHINFNPKNTL